MRLVLKLLSASNLGQIGIFYLVTFLFVKIYYFVLSTAASDFTAVIESNREKFMILCSFNDLLLGFLITFKFDSFFTIQVLSL